MKIANFLFISLKKREGGLILKNANKQRLAKTNEKKNEKHTYLYTFVAMDCMCGFLLPPFRRYTYLPTFLYILP